MKFVHVLKYMEVGRGLAVGSHNRNELVFICNHGILSVTNPAVIMAMKNPSSIQYDHRYLFLSSLDRFLH